MVDQIESMMGKAKNRGMKEGSLYSIVNYVSYTSGDSKADLDGEFSIEQLEDIVNHMKNHKDKNV